MKTITNGFAIRNEIKAVGGKFDGRDGWRVTDEQLATLLERAVRSFREFNKKDRALGLAFKGVAIEDEEGNEQSGKDAMAPLIAAAEAKSAAYRAKYQ